MPGASGALSSHLGGRRPGAARASSSRGTASRPASYLVGGRRRAAPTRRASRAVDRARAASRPRRCAEPSVTARPASARACARTPAAGRRRAPAPRPARGPRRRSRPSAPRCRPAAAPARAPARGCDGRRGGRLRAVDERRGAGQRRARGGEVRAEIAGGDLRRRPPQRLARGDRRRRRCARPSRSRPRADLGAQVQRGAADEQHAADDAAERLRVDRRAGRGGDRLGDGVGLLGGQAALLERERGDVARGVDVVDAGDPAVAVDRDEPVPSAGRPRMGWPSGRAARRPGRRRRRRRRRGRGARARRRPAARRCARARRGRPSAARWASAARGPNRASGACSGVTIVSSASSEP